MTPYQAAAAGATVTLAWNPSPESDVAGYIMHYGPASQNYTNVFFVGNVTNVTISGLAENSTNFFMVTSQSAAGLESDPSEEVSYVAKPTIILVTNGNGTVSPALSKLKLSFGNQYTLTAVPAAGQVFAGWSGNITASSPKITFTLASKLTVQANFIANPFVAAQGKYYGLFHENDAVRQASAGFLTMAVTAKGAYSGRLQIGAANYSFSGKLDLQGHATNTILRSTANALTLELQVGLGPQADQLSGRVTDGNWSAPLLGDRCVFNAATNPSPYAGRYTVIVPGQAGDPTLPTGDGYGTVLVDAGGTAHYASTLADGTKASQSVPVSRNGQWPLYVSLYSGKGSILAWLTFTNETGDDVVGQLSWIKPALPTASYYSGGFTNTTVAVGSGYVPPATATNCLLNLTNASVGFSGGALVANFTNSVVLGQDNKITNLSSNRLNLTITLTTGLFTGSATDPSSAKSLSFHGVVLQKQNDGRGFLLFTGQSSQVTLTR